MSEVPTAAREASPERDRRWWAAAAALTGLCAAVALTRWALTGQLGYAFLAKNLALAWLPAVLAFALRRSPALPGAIFAAALVSWVLFHPNAPYIVTDLVHLATPRKTILWMDVLAIGAAAAAGLMLGLASVQWVAEAIAARRGRPLPASGVAVVAAGLGALGVYFGRFARWNSWDVVTRPGELVIDAVNHLASAETWVFVGLFGLCLAVAHALFSSLMTQADGLR
jgi:uncharacterized membrane protein